MLMKIKQIAKRVKRAKRNLNAAERVIAHHTPLAQDKNNPGHENHEIMVKAADRVRRSSERTLGHALYYCGDHNIPISGEDAPKPFRDARPKHIQRTQTAHAS